MTEKSILQPSTVSQRATCARRMKSELTPFFNGHSPPSSCFLTRRFIDGVKRHEYGARQDRDYDTISNYIDARMVDMLPAATPALEPTPSPPPTKVKTPAMTGPPTNPDGISIPLTFESFSQNITPLNSRSITPGWFVKFYVPWCSHCQQMAPAWTELAREMKGKLNIAEVNCEVENKLCKDIKLRGYPTLIFFKGGERVEYDGLRGLGDLVSFAQKAVQYNSST